MTTAPKFFKFARDAERFVIASGKAASFVIKPAKGGGAIVERAA